MPFEYAREAILHFDIWVTGANPDGARHIGRAVQILPAGVDQIDAVRLN